jgi:hypothetical protein
MNATERLEKAAIRAHRRGPNDVTDWGGFVLWHLFDSIGGGDPAHCWIKYCDLLPAIRETLGVNNDKVNSLRARLSRAVWRLIQEGMIEGWFRCWNVWGAKDAPSPLEWWEEGMLHGESPFARSDRQRPRIVWLRLTELACAKHKEKVSERETP